MLTSPLSLGSLAGASLASLVDSCALTVAGAGAVNADGDVAGGGAVTYEGPCRLTAVRRDVELAKLAGAEVDADATVRLPLLDAATRAAFERGVDAIRGTVTKQGVTRPVTVAGIRPGRIATVLYVRLGAPVTDLVPLNAVAERVAGLLDGTAPAAAGLTSPKPAEVAALLDVLARDKAGQPSGRPPGVFAVALPEDVPDRAVLVRVMEPPGGYDVVAVSPSGLVRPTLQVLAVVRSGAVGSPSRVLDLVQRRAFACLTSGVGPVSARTGALVGVPGTAAPASPLSIVAAPGPPQRFADDLLYTAARFTCGVYLS